MIRALSHIRTWIFDLDNTLYPSSAALFPLIDERMGRYIGGLLGLDRTDAYALQKRYFRDHGTTLAGLMANHDVEPREFLDFVHDIPLDALAPDPRIVERIARLPGKRLVFTNGDAAYAERVLDRLGLSGLFAHVHDIHALDYCPKPDPRGYARMCDALDFDPATALFVEDMARNLVPAKALGMTTVWVNNGSELGDWDRLADAIDYEIGDLAGWLGTIMEEENA